LIAWLAVSEDVDTALTACVGVDASDTSVDASAIVGCVGTTSSNEN
jgi:hypothetical protein